MNLNKKRDNYLTWDEYFMSIAKLSSMRSKDPSTQVGACIVGLDNRILSIGYNGAPNGYSDDHFPWQREGDMLNTKYAYVCHAEMNAILNYRGTRKELENSKIYVDLFPCNECAKLIIQAGIKEVVYLSSKFKDKDGKLKETDSVKASKKMFKECDVKMTEVKLDKDKIEIDLQKR